MKQKYSVKGMTCSACENHVHNSVCKLPGVNNVEVNLLTNSMKVEFDENQVNDAMIIKAVNDLSLIHIYIGRLWIYGTYRLCYGSNF